MSSPQVSSPSRRSDALVAFITAALAWLTLATALPASAAPRPKILGVSHAAFYVHDLNLARRYYEDFLGLDEAFATPDSVWVRVNDHQWIVLAQEKESGTDRLAHFAFATDHAADMGRYLKSVGIEVGEVSRDETGSRFVSCRDPDGTPLRFVEVSPSGPLGAPVTRHVSTTPISNRITHFGAQSTDLARSIHFYGDLLGGSEIWRGGQKPGTVRWVMLHVHDGEDWTELVVNPGQATVKQLGTWHHICLLVPDCDATLATLRHRPLPEGAILSTKVDTGTDRKRQIHAFDPDGTRLEIMEPAPR